MTITMGCWSSCLFIDRHLAMRHKRLARDRRVMPKGVPHETSIIERHIDSPIPMPVGLVVKNVLKIFVEVFRSNHQHQNPRQ